MTQAFLEKATYYLLYLILLFLPTQLGKHFFPDFTLVSGIRIDYLSPTLYVSDILVVIFLFFSALLYRKSITKNWKRYSFALFRKKAMLVFFLILLLSTFFSVNKLEAFYALIKLGEFSLFALCIAIISKKAMVPTVLRIFSVIIISEGLLAAIQFFHQGAVGGIFYFLGERFITPQTPGAANVALHGVLMLRPYGTFSHPNVLAGFLVLGMTLVLLNSSLTTLKNKIICGSVLLIGTLALLLTLSRVAILVWLVVCIYYFLSKRKYISFRQAVSVAIVFSALLFLIFLTPLHFRFVDTLIGEESFQQRQQLVLVSYAIIRDHLLFGVGPNNFLPILPYYFHTPTSFLQPVHNIFILIAAQLGLTGLCLVLYFCFRTFIRLKTILRTKTEHSFIFSIALCLILVCVLGQSDHYFLTLEQGQLLVAFLFGQAYAKHVA